MKKAVVAEHHTHPGSLRLYVTGFILSLVLTLAAYFCTTHHAASGWALIGVLSALAVAQLMVQLLFFLHIGDERKPRWNLNALLFAAMVVVIIVFGSLWIMKNLYIDHHHVPVNENSKSIINDEGYSNSTP